MAQSGPRFLTEFDINQAHQLVSLTPGSANGQTGGTGFTISQLGQVGQTGTGDYYRLVGIGGSSTVAPGQLLVAPAISSAYEGLAIPSSQPANTAFGNASNNVNSALSAGSYSFNVTNGSTAVTAGQFAGGYVLVNQTSGTDNGPIAFLLAGNSVAAADGTITLTLVDPLNVASALVAGTDTVTLVQNPWNNCEASSTLGVPVGVLTVQAPNTASATYCAWVKTRGIAAVTADATGVTVGEAVAQSTTTAGDVTVAGATSNQVGVAVESKTSGVTLVELTLV
jgi:hypothetical protein